VVITPYGVDEIFEASHVVSFIRTVRYHTSFIVRFGDIMPFFVPLEPCSNKTQLQAWKK